MGWVTEDGFDSPIAATGRLELHSWQRAHLLVWQHRGGGGLLIHLRVHVSTYQRRVEMDGKENWPHKQDLLYTQRQACFVCTYSSSACIVHISVAMLVKEHSCIDNWPIERAKYIETR